MKNFILTFLFFSSISWAQKVEKLDGASPIEALPCSPDTPTINLEEEGGPFFNIPRDNQDGLGTCYANVAKNLLVGVTEGRVNPSFLDLAIQFKLSQGGFSEALDYGRSCETIRSVSASGICPQQFSPMETGERLGVHDMLFPRESALGIQADMLNNLRLFLNSRAEIKTAAKRDQNLSGFEARTREMVQAFRSNRNIKFPLPVLDSAGLPRHALEKLYQKANLPEENKASFVAGYEERFNRFRPLLVNAIMQNKTREEIQALYQEHINSYLSDNSVTYDNTAFTTAISSPAIHQEVRETLAFIQTYGGLNYQEPSQFEQICNPNPAMMFFENLFKLVSQIETNGSSPDALFNPDGSLKSNGELMQLAVAPACLNPANRQLLPFVPTCNEVKFDEQQTPLERSRIMRENVLTALRNRLPVGQVFPTGSGSHINTIVGIRFDSNSNQCQYLIRESQTGESTWQSEISIASRVRELTIVGRP